MSATRKYVLHMCAMEKADIPGNEAPVGLVRYVLASDYDRDTQALRDELAACTESPGG